MNRHNIRPSSNQGQMNADVCRILMDHDDALLGVERSARSIANGLTGSFSVGAMVKADGSHSLEDAVAGVDYAAAVHSHPWSSITSTPTTRLGYGIIDAAPLIHGVSAGYLPYANSTTSWANSPLYTNGTNVAFAGSTLAAWSGPRAIQMGLAGFLYAGTASNGLDIGENTYVSGSGLKYINNGYAEYLEFGSGTIKLLTAASGSAGGSATFHTIFRAGQFGATIGSDTEPTGMLDIYTNATADYQNLFLRQTGLAQPFTALAPATAGLTALLMPGCAGIGAPTIRGFSVGAYTGLTLVGHIGTASATIPALALAGYKWDGVTPNGNRIALAATEMVAQILNGATPLISILGNGNVNFSNGNLTTTGQIFVNNGTLEHLRIANRFSHIGSANYHITNNAYYSSGFKYTATGAACKMAISAAGAFTFSYAGSGTKDAAVTFADVLTCDASGNLTALAGFGCNTKAAQPAYTVNAVCTDLPSAVALLNQVRAALVADGICV